MIEVLFGKKNNQGLSLTCSLSYYQQFN